MGGPARVRPEKAPFLEQLGEYNYVAVQNEKYDACQLQGVIRNSPTAKEKKLPPGLKFKRALKRRLSVRADKTLKRAYGAVLDIIDGALGKRPPVAVTREASRPVRLEAGDLVRVRSREEIEATLDRWHALKGCGFLGEMAGYCGTTQRVLKRVERFIDERDYRLKQASGIVLLEGAICSGTGATGRCDRACFFFWREEWLEKLDSPAGVHV